MHSAWAYYKELAKEFGRLCYESWRRELFAAVFVTLIAYGLSFRDKGAWESTKIALEANAIVLFCFAVFHLIRVPYLVYRRTVPPVSLEQELVFLGEEITPGYLVGISKGHTTVQAQKLAEVYLNKGMKVSGVVGDVEDRREYMRLHVYWKETESEEVSVFFSFGANWRDRILTLKKGQRITAKGRIDRCSSYISLEDCELIEPH